MVPTKPSTTVPPLVRQGCFDLIFSELSASDAAESPDATESEVLMIDATDLKTHPTASSLNKGGMTSKLHGVCHSKGGPRRLHLREGNAVTSLALVGCSRSHLLLR